SRSARAALLSSVVMAASGVDWGKGATVHTTGRVGQRGRARFGHDSNAFDRRSARNATRCDSRVRLTAAPRKTRLPVIRPSLNSGDGARVLRAPTLESCRTTGGNNETQRQPNRAESEGRFRRGIAGESPLPVLRRQGRRRGLQRRGCRVPL